jgi:hypothetical protein
MQLELKIDNTSAVKGSFAEVCCGASEGTSRNVKKSPASSGEADRCLRQKISHHHNQRS